MLVANLLVLVFAKELVLLDALVALELVLAVAAGAVLAVARIVAIGLAHKSVTITAIANATANALLDVVVAVWAVALWLARAVALERIISLPLRIDKSKNVGTYRSKN